MAWLTRVGFAVAVAASVASCTAILGNDFTITDGTSSGGGGPGGAGGAGLGGVGGTGGTGGGEGGMGATGPAPFNGCTWDSFVQVESLMNQSGVQYNGGQVYMLRSTNKVRWVVEASSPNGSFLKLFTADENDVYVASYPGDRVGPLFRLDGDTVAIPYAFDLNPDVEVRWLEVDDGDSNGGSGTPRTLSTLFGNISEFETFGLSSGDGTATLIYTARRDAAERAARVLHWNGTSATAPVIFNDSTSTPSLNSNDYEITLGVRDGTNNHVVLGGAFDNASHTRHFVVPDDAAGPIAPILDVVVDLSAAQLAGVRGLSDGSFFVADVQLSGAGSAFLGTVPFDQIATHDPTTLAATTLDPSTIPSGATVIILSDQSFVVAGTSLDASEGLRLLVIHRQSGVRFDGSVALPTNAGLPANFEVERVAAVVADPGFDTTLGGKIYASFTIKDTNLGHQEVYLGRLNCK